MKSVLMAVHPEFCSLIVSGEKTIELRKTRPKIETPFKVYVYCTLPKKSGDAFLVGETPRCANGKVICEFVCNKIEVIKQREVFNADVLCSTTCLTIKEFLDYIGNSTAYFWHISDLVIYDKPKELCEFCKPTMPTGLRYENDTITRPPQSWCYVEE